MSVLSGGMLACGSQSVPSKEAVAGAGGAESGGRAGDDEITDPFGSGGVMPDETDPDVCAEVETSAQLIATNLLFVVDKSGSMRCNAPPIDSDCLLPEKKVEEEASKWEATRAALVGRPDTSDRGEGALRMLENAQGVSAGLVVFPLDGRCGILPRGELTTPLAPLNGAQLEALSEDLNLEPDGETPLAGAAIRGLDILRAGLVSGEFPGHGVLVVMTDGAETCQPAALSDLKDYVSVAWQEFGISTFVIGAPGSEQSRALLSEIAFRGGTASRADCNHGSDTETDGDCHVDLTESEDFSRDLATVFSSIAMDTKSSCDFDVPRDAFVDPNKVNVLFSSSDGGQDTVVFDDRDCDSAANGWQYTSDEKEKIVLCGDACQRVRTEPDARVDVVFGCRDTVVR